MSETISVHNMFSPGLSLEFSCIELVCNSMNNLSPYCGLVNAKIRAYDKNLPVLTDFYTFFLIIEPFYTGNVQLGTHDFEK